MAKKCKLLVSGWRLNKHEISAVLSLVAKGHQEPQWGPGKHFCVGPLWGKSFWTFLFKMAHSGVFL